MMKHLSHFVQPGSRLLKVSDGKNTLAFRSHDGKVVVVAYNPEEQERPCSFKVGSKYIRVILKGKSINTNCHLIIFSTFGLSISAYCCVLKNKYS